MEPGPFLGGQRPRPLARYTLPGWVILATPADGNCLFHAVLNGIAPEPEEFGSSPAPTRAERLAGEYRTARANQERLSAVRRFRSELADFLAAPGGDKGNVYESLAKGELANYARTMAAFANTAAEKREAAQYTLEGMQRELRAFGHGVGQQHIELISRFANRDVHILHRDDAGEIVPFVVRDLEEELSEARGGRDSIVLFLTPTTEKEELRDPHSEGHYELIARVLRAGRLYYQTEFGPGGDIVATIRAKLTRLFGLIGAGRAPAPRRSTPTPESSPVLRVYFGAGDAEELVNRGSVHLLEARPEVGLEWRATPASLHAVAIYHEDIDLLFLAVNTRGADLNTADVLVKIPPFVPAGDYEVIIYDQRRVGRIANTSPTFATLRLLDRLPVLEVVGFRATRE
jgi:hypothetical protein